MEKRKFLIQRTLWENTEKEMGDTDTDTDTDMDDNQTETGDLNVWKLLSDELKEDENAGEPQEVFEKLRRYFLLSRSLKRDKIFHSVMEMIRENMHGSIEPMDYNESLSYAIDQKSSDIL